MVTTKKPKRNLSRRSKEKYPALKPELNLRSRFELLEVDYLDKLSEKEKKWLNKFNEEYVNDKLDRKNLNKNLHKTKELKKDCDDRNNARNRDVLNRGKAAGNLSYIEDLKKEDSLIKTPEQVLLEKEKESKGT